MRAKVKLNGTTVGYLERNSGGSYTYNYINGYNGPPISRSFKKLNTSYKRSDGYLFPYFSGLLSEGAQKDLQCRLLKISPDDDFTRLVKTCRNTIGGITVEEVD